MARTYNYKSPEQLARYPEVALAVRERREKIRKATLIALVLVAVLAASYIAWELLR